MIIGSSMLLPWAAAVENVTTVGGIVVTGVMREVSVDSTSVTMVDEIGCGSINGIIEEAVVEH